MISIVENIRELCNEKGITIAELERAVGLSNGSLSRWDKSSPSLKNVQKVCDFFGETVDSITGKERLNKNVKTIAAHLEDKNLDDRKMRLLMGYLNVLFNEVEEDLKRK